MAHRRAARRLRRVAGERREVVGQGREDRQHCLAHASRYAQAHLHATIAIAIAEHWLPIQKYMYFWGVHAHSVLLVAVMLSE